MKYVLSMCVWLPYGPHKMPSAASRSFLTPACKRKCQFKALGLLQAFEESPTGLRFHNFAIFLRVRGGSNKTHKVLDIFSVVDVRSRGVTRLDGARGKKQVWRRHVRNWGLSEANVLYWRQYCNIVGSVWRPRSHSAPHSESTPGELRTPLSASLCPWLGDHRSNRQFAGRRMLQPRIIWLADCSSAPQMHLVVSSMLCDDSGLRVSVYIQVISLRERCHSRINQ